MRLSRARKLALSALLLLMVARRGAAAQAASPGDSIAGDHGICVAVLKPEQRVVQWGVSAEFCRKYCAASGLDARRMKRDCIFDANEQPWSASPDGVVDEPDPSGGEDRSHRFSVDGQAHRLSGDSSNGSAE